MNLRILPAFLAMTLLASGCVVRDRDPCNNCGNPPPTPPSARSGDVGFTWTLAGLQCSQAGVSRVRITIPGESLENGGNYPCAANGVMGVVLHDFAPGSYPYTLEGIDSANVVRYRASGTFRVDGDVTVRDDLEPLDAVVNLTWRFPGNADHPNNPTCDQAFVSWMAIYVDDQPVKVDVDGQLSEWIPCGWGQSQEGFSLSLASGGNHTLTVYAADDSGYVFYEYVNTVQAYTGQVVSNALNMQWAVGEGAVKWVLKSAGHTLSCDEAGVDFVYVQLIAPNGDRLFDGDGDRWACDAYGVIYDYLYPNDYQVVLKVKEGGATTFISDPATPRLRVTAGVFTDGANPLVVPVYEVL